VKHGRIHGRSTTRKLVVALAAGAMGVGLIVAPASAQPTPPNCRADIVSSSVRDPDLGPGRRAVATFFFGDDPHAVQTGAQAVKDFCG
jgi:hypothetical protein